MVEKWLGICDNGNMKRKIPLVNGEVYHILNRSIAEYKIFNSKEDYLRMEQVMKYYQIKLDHKYSYFITLNGVVKDGFNNYFEEVAKDEENFVQIIAYCLMPTHLHLILKQLEDNGISKYMGDILNSYTRYFNNRHKRKGPLWEEKFKNVLVESDEQLLHLTRYIHLNPTTAFLVKKPEDWDYSSYKEYLGKLIKFKMCDYANILDINPSLYRKFINDRISYQRELAKIKALVLD